MEYKGTLIAVQDIAKAKQFYQSVLGLEVVLDAGANVQLSGGIFLQTAATWVDFIHKQEEQVLFGSNTGELYFETPDMAQFSKKLINFPNIVYLHPVIEHSWGQRAVRFYDLDHHIIEVAENIAMVAKRFLNDGLTLAETAARMEVDIAYIETITKK